MTVLWQSICTFWLCNLFSTSTSFHQRRPKTERKFFSWCCSQCLTFLSIININIQSSLICVSRTDSQSVEDAHIPTHKYAHSPSPPPPPPLKYRINKVTLEVDQKKKTHNDQYLSQSAVLLMSPWRRSRSSDQWVMTMDTIYWQISQSSAPPFSPWVSTVYKLFIYELGE